MNNDARDASLYAVKSGVTHYPEQYLSLHSFDDAPPYLIVSFMGMLHTETMLMPQHSRNSTSPSKKNYNLQMRRRRDRVATEAQRLLDELRGISRPPAKEKKALPPTTEVTKTPAAVVVEPLHENENTDVEPHSEADAKASAPQQHDDEQNNSNGKEVESEPAPTNAAAAATDIHHDERNAQSTHPQQQQQQRAEGNSKPTTSQPVAPAKQPQQQQQQPAKVPAKASCC